MSTPEHDLVLVRRLEVINQDENPIERERKLDQFYEELDALELADYDQAVPPPDKPPTPGKDTGFDKEA